MDLNSSDLFPTVFNKDFKSVLSHEYTEFIEAGGRGSCKSSFVSICIVLLMLQHKDANALVIRKYQNTLRDSVYEQILWAIDKLNVNSLFTCTVSPMQINLNTTGQKIIFRGADEPTKIKSIKVKQGYLSVLWLEESVELTFDETNSIKLSALRGGSTFWVFDSFNPPSSLRNWKNADILKPKSNRLVHKTDYRTTPPEWLGDTFLFEAEQMRTTNERAYRNIFLGEATGSGSTVFDNIELRKIPDDEINTFELFFYGEDFGFFPDYNRTIGMAYNPQKMTLYIIYELSLRKLGNWEVSEKRKEFFEANGIALDERITADSAEPKTIMDNRHWGWNMRGAIKGKGSLEMGFKWLQSRAKIVIDPERCPFTADEFSLYEFPTDRKTGEIMQAYNTDQPDHSIAAVRYAMNDYILQRGN